MTWKNNMKSALSWVLVAHMVVGSVPVGALASSQIDGTYQERDIRSGAMATAEYQVEEDTTVVDGTGGIALQLSSSATEQLVSLQDENGEAIADVRFELGAVITLVDDTNNQDKVVTVDEMTQNVQLAFNTDEIYGYYTDSDFADRFSPDGEVVYGDLTLYVKYAVPAGNPVYREEYMWDYSPLYKSNGGNQNVCGNHMGTRLPSGWEIVDYQACVCGVPAILIQGDGVYAVAHAECYSYNTSTAHYYQWNVTLADGTVVEIDGSGLQEGDARQLERRSDSTTTAMVRLILNDGAAYNLINGSSTALRVWKATENGGTNDTATFYSSGVTVLNQFSRTQTGNVFLLEQLGGTTTFNTIYRYVPQEGNDSTWSLAYKNVEHSPFPEYTHLGNHIKSWNDDVNFRGNEIEVNPYASPNSNTTYHYYAKIHDYWHGFYPENGEDTIWIGQNIGDDFVLPEEPTKNGFEFYGWYTDSTLETLFDGTTMEVTTDLDLYAKWGTVRLDIGLTGFDTEGFDTVKVPVGGFIVQTDVELSYDDDDRIFVTTGEENLELLEPAKVDGYVFDSWEVQYDENENVLIVPVYKKIVTISIEGSDGEIHGSHEIIEGNFIIQYDVDGEVIRQVEITADMSEIVLDDPEEKAGFVFGGWDIQVDGLNITVEPIYLALVPVEVTDADGESLGDFVLVDGDKITVQDELGNTATQVTIDTDAEELQLPEPPEKDGFVFDQWVVEETDEGLTITPTYLEIVTVEILDFAGEMVETLYLVEGETLEIYDENGDLLSEITVAVDMGTVQLPEMTDSSEESFRGWESKTTDDGITSVQPIYLAFVPVEVTDADGESLGDFELVDGDKITVQDEQGNTATQVTIDTDTEELQLPEPPEKDGFVFDQWVVEETDEGLTITPTYLEIVTVEIWDFAGETVKTLYLVEGETLEIYDENGDLLSEITVAVDMDTVQLPEMTDSSEGVFRGWAVKTIGSNTTIKPIYGDLVELVITDADGMNLGEYVLEADTTIVIMDQNGDPADQVTVELGMDDIQLPEGPEKDGYQFVNWDIQETVGGLVITPMYAKIVDVTFETEEDVVMSDIEFVEGDKIIIFDEKGEVLQEVVVTDSMDDITLTAPEKDGFIFDKWIIEKDDDGVTVKPTYLQQVTVNIKDQEGEELENLDLVEGDTIQIYDEDGTLVEETVVTGGMDCIQLPEPTVREDDAFVEWEIVNNDGIVTVKPLYESDFKTESNGSNNKPNTSVATATVEPEVEEVEEEQVEVLETLINTSFVSRYMYGYVDNTFGPEKSMTRDEVVTMLSRLLADAMPENWNQPSSFADVPEDAWCALELGYMESLGLIEGRGNGIFGWGEAITRAEFATLTSRFSQLVETEEVAFSDVAEDHWASGAISSAFALGWVTGYEDGTFKPDQSITRAEVVTVVNRVLSRTWDEAVAEAHPEFVRSFLDVDSKHWAYADICESTSEWNLED